MLGRDVQRQFAARAHLLALQARTKRTVTPDDEKLNHCIALLRTNSFENQERGIKFMTRLAKQGCQVFVYYDGRSSLRDVIERTQNDDFGDYYSTLRLLRWASECSESTMKILGDADIISILNQHLRQSDNRCFAMCCRAWSNILEYDAAALSTLARDGYLGDVFRAFNHFIDLVATDDEALDVVTAILNFVPLVVVNSMNLGVERAELLQNATSCIIQCITHSCKDITLPAVRSFARAAEVADTAILSVFFRESCFDCYLELCNSERSEVASRAITAVSHFTRLDEDECERLLPILFQRLNFSTDSDIITAILWLGRLLIMKSRAMAFVVLSSEQWEFIGCRTPLTFKNKELYALALSESLHWRETEFVVTRVEMFADLVCLVTELLTSVTESNLRVMLAGLSSLIGFLEVCPCAQIAEQFRNEALIEFLHEVKDEHAKAILEFANKTFNCE